MAGKQYGLDDYKNTAEFCKINLHSAIVLVTFIFFLITRGFWKLVIMMLQEAVILVGITAQKKLRNYLAQEIDQFPGFQSLKI